MAKVFTHKDVIVDQEFRGSADAVEELILLDAGAIQSTGEPGPVVGGKLLKVGAWTVGKSAVGGLDEISP